MEAMLSVISYDQIDAPPILYKYRNWGNDLHKTIITRRTVYMAPPSTFEDELEFRNFKRYDLMTTYEAYKKYLQMSHEYNRHFTRAKHRAYARAMVKLGHYKNPRILKEWQENHYKEYNSKVGVLSLTKHNNELPIWNYYANNGTGFSVGLDSKILFKLMGAGGEVHYPPDGLPIIHGTDDFTVQRWKQIYNKHPKFEWEKEYRVDSFKIAGMLPEQRLVTLPPECYKEVIFGWQMDDDTRNWIMTCCLESGLAVAYYQATLDEESNTVTICPLNQS